MAEDPKKRQVPGEVMGMMGQLTRLTARRYPHLQKALAEVEWDQMALNDMHRLIQDLELAVDNARRDGRKDVLVRGRFHP